MPRTRNATANPLLNVASRMSLIRDRFTIKILYRHKVRDLSGMMNFVYDPCIQQFSKLFLYDGFKRRIYFSQLLLIWLDPFLDRDDMLDDPCVIFFQIIIHPCEHISILFEQEDEGLSFLLCTTCTKVDKFRILFCS